MVITVAPMLITNSAFKQDMGSFLNNFYYLIARDSKEVKNIGQRFSIGDKYIINPEASIKCQTVHFHDNSCHRECGFCHLKEIK